MDLFGDKTLYITNRDAILPIITICYKLFAPAKVELFKRANDPDIVGVIHSQVPPTLLRERAAGGNWLWITPASRVTANQQIRVGVVHFSITINGTLSLFH